MDSFELNKLIGAFLAVVFVVFSVSIASDAIFSAHAPDQQGYVIEVAEAQPDAEEEGDAGPSIAELLQTADADAGQAAFRACAACHTVDEGGANRIGPNLWDVVGRPVAAHPGFNYSAGMRDFAQDGATVWDYEHLSGFLRSPRAYVPGTSMAFPGIRDPQQEANMIAYLRSLSDDPAPLPDAAASEEPEEADSPAEGTAPEPATIDDGTSASPEADAGVPSGEAPAEETPAEEAPVEEAPAEEEPAEEEPGEEEPGEEAPAGEEPVEEEPADQ